LTHLLEKKSFAFAPAHFSERDATHFGCARHAAAKPPFAAAMSLKIHQSPSETRVTFGRTRRTSMRRFKLRFGSEAQYHDENRNHRAKKFGLEPESIGSPFATDTVDPASVIAASTRSLTLMITSMAPGLMKSAPVAPRPPAGGSRSGTGESGHRCLSVGALLPVARAASFTAGATYAARLSGSMKRIRRRTRGLIE